MKVTLIVAKADNDIIGKNGTLPWHIPADLKRYKARTMGKPLIMGRKTLESLYKEVGGPLPGRTNIIVTRQGDFKTKDGVLVSSSIDEALSTAKQIAIRDGVDEIFINGGAQIYKQALESDFLTDLDIAHVHDDIEGDTSFPTVNWNDWEECSREDHEAANGKPAFSFVQYKRK